MSLDSGNQALKKSHLLQLNATHSEITVGRYSLQSFQPDPTLFVEPLKRRRRHDHGAGCLSLRLRQAGGTLRKGLKYLWLSPVGRSLHSS
ncbi:MAG: hypothetical protein ACXWC3_23745 [Burkholderiales bacterium]